MAASVTSAGHPSIETAVLGCSVGRGRSITPPPQALCPWGCPLRPDTASALSSGKRKRVLWGARGASTATRPAASRTGPKTDGRVTDTPNDTGAGGRGREELPAEPANEPGGLVTAE